MWKLLIADDESIIRRGIRGSINWDKFDIEIVGEAEDGEVALEKCKELRPDILLVDICMPFLNGLELIEAVNSILPNTIILIITGHNEFEYAQKAIRMNVVDYILKPIDEDELEEIVCKMVEMLDIKKKENSIANLEHYEVRKNFNHMRELFLLEILKGNEESFDNKFKYYNVDTSKKMGIVVLNHIGNECMILQDKRITVLANIKNTVKLIIKNYIESIVTIDRDNNTVVALYICDTISDFHKICISLEKRIQTQLGKDILVYQNFIGNDIKNIEYIYSSIIKNLNKNKEYSPSVTLAKKYIENYYYKSQLTLDVVANFINVNPTYLSRLLKNELGSSFIDYLTKVRIKKSIEFMEENSMKLYEIAEEVGYNTQHYFSTAFKKVMGVSPNHYRLKGVNRKND